MTASLRHRGPDSYGHASDQNAYVGATRLNIIDAGAGAQPIYNETRRACVVFNGEIYNHRELRAQLQKKGHVFRTATDTEVIIHLYEEMGERCVERLHGMFAFAILDGEQLFLARDRMGIKPLYYASLAQPALFIFASEIKAILAHPDFRPELNRQAVADYIVLRHAVEGDTFFRGVAALPAGHTLTVSYGADVRVGKPRRYYARDFNRDEDIDFDAAQAALESTLEAAVKTHLDADVEIGLTLSGGLDSAVLALLAGERAQQRLCTFTVGDRPDHPDVVHAQNVAQMIGSDHESVMIGFEQYLAAIPGLIAAEEKPTSGYGVPFYILCDRIARRVKACIHGEGADEVLGGYDEYLDRDARMSYIRRRLPLLKDLGIAPSDRAVATIKRLLLPSTFDDYLQCVFEINQAEPLEQQHLVPVDKIAMASSLEMRVPYLDDAVFELANRMPLRFLVRSDLGIGKYILRRLALKRFGPQVTDIVLRQKLGFPTSGLRLLNCFNRLCGEVLPDSYVTKHELGRCCNKGQLLLFDLFVEIFMEHRGNSAAVGGVLEFMHSRAARARSPCGRKTRRRLDSETVQ